MSIKQPYSTSLRSVGAYQVSGRPWVAGNLDVTSSTKIQFPFVTRWISIANTSGTAVKLSFSAGGAAADAYFEIPPNSISDRLEIKCSEIWLIGGAANKTSVMAGLTNIPRDQMYTLTGDGIS